MFISQFVYWMLWIAIGLWTGVAIIDSIQLRIKNKKVIEQETEIILLKGYLDKTERQLKIETAEKERYQKMAGFYADLLSYKRNNGIK